MVSAHKPLEAFRNADAHRVLIYEIAVSCCRGLSLYKSVGRANVRQSRGQRSTSPTSEHGINPAKDGLKHDRELYKQDRQGSTLCEMSGKLCSGATKSQNWRLSS